MVKTIDPKMTLDGFSLKEALESIYSTFASVLLGHGAPDGPDLYRRVIPMYVFDAAVGAGWLPLADPDDVDIAVGMAKGEVIWQADWQVTEKTKLPQWVRDHIEEERRKGRQPPTPTKYTKNQAQRLYQFGDFIVDRDYLKSFYAFLADVMSFHLADGTQHEERLKSLPTKTPAKERQALLNKYIAEGGTAGHKLRMKDIAQLAGVDYSVLIKWKNGRIADSEPAAQRISLLLRFNERNAPRAYRRRS
jgi:hypothetical protein